MGSLVETLREIASLQPYYTPENSPRMRERGHLIRRRLPEEINALAPQLSGALSDFGADFMVDASDGIGRKTEAPWVRFASRAMSPTPRDGFYVVIHFSADGASVWVTLGCGSTVWTGGDLKSLPIEELKRRTDWARAVIRQRFGSLEPFTDEIALGARAALPRTFERATAVALRLDPNATSEEQIEEALHRAAIFLAEIYLAQKTGGHLSPAQVAELQIEEVSRPAGRHLNRQGIGLSAEERRAVERRAMEIATDWLMLRGYSVVDRSATAPFDLEASNPTHTLKVEVKGTTSLTCDDFIMTKNEVELHRREAGSTGLVLVSGIRLDKVDGSPVGLGGVCEARLGWDIGDWLLEPMAYRVRRQLPSRGTA